MLDHFQMGPNLVRGFATAGIGPRDMTLGTTERRARRHDVLGRQSSKSQVPIFGVPKDFGMQARGLRRRRLGLGLQGPDQLPGDGTSVDDGRSGHRRGYGLDDVRSSVGAGIIWDSPFGPIRFDYAYPLTKDPNDRDPAASASAAAPSSDLAQPRHGQGGMTEPHFFAAPARG